MNPCSRLDMNSSKSSLLDLSASNLKSRRVIRCHMYLQNVCIKYDTGLANNNKRPVLLICHKTCQHFFPTFDTFLPFFSSILLLSTRKLWPTFELFPLQNSDIFQKRHLIYYSGIHNSIAPSKELCSKRALGEVGVSLPWWCHTLVLLPPGYWGLFLNLIIFS